MNHTGSRSNHLLACASASAMGLALFEDIGFACRFGEGFFRVDRGPVPVDYLQAGIERVAVTRTAIRRPAVHQAIERLVRIGNGTGLAELLEADLDRMRKTLVFHDGRNARRVSQFRAAPGHLSPTAP